MSIINIDNIISENFDKAYYIFPQKKQTLAYSDIKKLGVSYLKPISEVEERAIVFIQLHEPYRMIPTLLACWHRGVTTAILPPDTPQDKFDALAEVIQSKIIITDKDAGELNGVEYIRIDSSEDLSNGASTASSDPVHCSLNINLDQEKQAALILFSSGTTGTPKCVPLSIKNLYSNISAFANLLNLDKNDVFLCSSPYWYAHGLYNSFITAFFLEATIIYPGILNMMNATPTLQAACDHNATVYHIAPSMIPILNMIASRKKLIPDFRYVISGTAKLEMEQKQQFEETFKIPISQQYGMTESLFMAINYQRQKENPESVGTAVGCVLEIHDDVGNVLGIGETGEVAVKSDAAFGSYYYQSDETLATYKNGWFYTGDLGQIDNDGYLTITGRLKEIIKKGGVNISPYEIEKVIRQIPAIKDVVTVGLDDKIYGEEIYSVVETTSKDITEDTVLEHCSEHLTKTHVPKKIFFVDKFPLTSSGKIARNELKSLAKEKVAGASSF